MYGRRVYLGSCICLQICTPSSQVVYVFTYMQTEFTCVCVYINIYTIMVENLDKYQGNFMSNMANSNDIRMNASVHMPCVHFSFHSGAAAECAEFASRANSGYCQSPCAIVCVGKCTCSFAVTAPNICP